MKQKTQKERVREQQNLGKLPQLCLAVRESNDTIIVLRRGERGFETVDAQLAHKRPSTMTKSDWVDVRNLRLGVTKQQQQAMLHGSMWGWTGQCADPDMYDEFGNIIAEKFGCQKKTSHS